MYSRVGMEQYLFYSIAPIMSVIDLFFNIKSLESRLREFFWSYPITRKVDQNCLGKNTNQLCVQFRDLIGWLVRLTLVCIWFVFLPCNSYLVIGLYFYLGIFDLPSS